MDSLFAYLEYLHDNPPIGGLYKQFIEARYGTGPKTTPTHTSKPMNAKECKMAEKQTIHNLCASFGVDINSLQKKPKRKLRAIE